MICRDPPRTRSACQDWLTLQRPICAMEAPLLPYPRAASTGESANHERAVVASRCGHSVSGCPGRGSTAPRARTSSRRSRRSWICWSTTSPAGGSPVHDEAPTTLRGPTAWVLARTSLLWAPSQRPCQQSRLLSPCVKDAVKRFPVVDVDEQPAQTDSGLPVPGPASGVAAWTRMSCIPSITACVATRRW